MTPRGSVTVRIGTHLWLIWLEIVAEHERAAADARERTLALAARKEDYREPFGQELRESMIAISGAAHAIDALYGEIRSMVPVPAELRATWKAKRTARHRIILETFKRGCQLGELTDRWPAQLRWLYDLRDPIVHHAIRHLPAVPHPNGITSSSQEAADYCVENARASADLAREVALTALRRPRAPALVSWAEAMPHVPDVIEATR